KACGPRRGPGQLGDDREGLQCAELLGVDRDQQGERQPAPPGLVILHREVAWSRGRAARRGRRNVRTFPFPECHLCARSERAGQDTLEKRTETESDCAFSSLL